MPLDGFLRSCLVAALFGALLAPTASAITIRDDTPDSDYQALATSYTSVGKVLNTTPTLVGTGTLIAPNYVLTAAHMTQDGTGFSFVTNDDVSHQGTWSQEHYNYTLNGTYYDIAIIRLDQPVTNVSPSPYYAGTGELTKTGTIVGYGSTGTGVTGYQDFTSGTRRACQNVLDATSLNGLILKADFDSPTDPSVNSLGSSTPLALEGAVGQYDSGGPIFIDVNGTPTIAGIVSGISPDTGRGYYGDQVWMTRVSSYASWINAIVNAGVHWNVGNGDYGTSSNWLYHVHFNSTPSSDDLTQNFVPNAADQTIFDRAGTYTVTFSSGPAAGANLTVSTGTVTFDLSGTTYQVAGIGAAPGVTVVGNTSGRAPSLTVTNGTLQADSIKIGATGGLSGSLLVGTGGTVNIQNYDIVGVASINVAAGRTATIPATGSLLVENGATFNKDGPGTLVVGGTVTLPGTSSLHVNQGTLQFDVAAATLTLAQALHCSGTLAKSGAGELIIAGLQDYASGAVFDVTGGTVVFDTDVGSTSSATLTLDVTGAEVDFGSNQHLDTLEIGPGGTVRIVGTHAVVVNHFVFDGFDFGAMTLMPEPATLALLGAGLAFLTIGRRGRAKPPRPSGPRGA